MKFLLSVISGLSTTALFVLAANSYGGELKASGYIEAEARYYPQTGLYEEQDDAFGSMAAELDIYWRSENEDHTVQFKPFARATTATDGNRDHADIRELYYSFSGSGWLVTAGVNKVFWGVTESAHLVDIVNQTDSVESFNGEEKLGQPMVALGLEQSWGNLDLYVLPYFRERKFASGSERNKLPLPINYHNTQFQSADEENHIDYAARWSNYFGNLDMAISYFNGTSREAIPVVSMIVANPSTLPGAPPILPSEFASYYQQLKQVGIEVQYLYNDWAFKLEGTHKNVDTGNYSEAATGFEYTWSDLGPWGQDVGFLAEYLWNNRQSVNVKTFSINAINDNPDYINNNPALDPNTSLPQAVEDQLNINGEFLSPFENDIFLGARFTLNDIDSTSFVAGFIYDLKSGTTIGSFEGSTRFGDNIRASLNVYIITTVPEDSSFYFSRRDDLIEAKVQYYF